MIELFVLSKRSIRKAKPPDKESISFMTMGPRTPQAPTQNTVAIVIVVVVVSSPLLLELVEALRPLLPSHSAGRLSPPSEHGGGGGVVGLLLTTDQHTHSYRPYVHAHQIKLGTTYKASPVLHDFAFSQRQR